MFVLQCVFNDLIFRSNSPLCTHPVKFCGRCHFLDDLTVHCIQTIAVDGEIIKKVSPLRSIVQKCEKFLTKQEMTAQTGKLIAL